MLRVLTGCDLLVQHRHGDGLGCDPERILSGVGTVVIPLHILVLQADRRHVPAAAGNDIGHRVADDLTIGWIQPVRQIGLLLAVVFQLIPARSGDGDAKIVDRESVGDGSRFACTGFTVHSRAAMSAKQHSRQEIIHFGFTSGRSVRRLFEPFLHSFEQVFVDDGRDGVFHFHVLIDVCADVSHILEHGFEAAFVKSRVLGCAITSVVERAADFDYAFPAGIALKCFLDNVCRLGVNHQFVIFEFIAPGNQSADRVAL